MLVPAVGEHHDTVRAVELHRALPFGDAPRHPQRVPHVASEEDRLQVEDLPVAPLGDRSLGAALPAEDLVRDREVVRRQHPHGVDVVARMTPVDTHRP